MALQNQHIGGKRNKKGKRLLATLLVFTLLFSVIPHITTVQAAENYILEDEDESSEPDKRTYYTGETDKLVLYLYQEDDDYYYDFGNDKDSEGAKSPVDLTYYEKETAKLEVYLYRNGNYVDLDKNKNIEIKWESSDSSIVNIQKTCTKSTKEDVIFQDIYAKIEAAKPGTATITATSKTGKVTKKVRILPKLNIKINKGKVINDKKKVKKYQYQVTNNSKEKISISDAMFGYTGTYSGGFSTYKLKEGTVTIKPGQTKTITFSTSETGFDPGIGLIFKYCGEKYHIWFNKSGQMESDII